MIGRTAFVATLLAGAIMLMASQAKAGVDGQVPRQREAAAAEKPACRAVKVVFVGRGEPARAPCRRA